MGSRSIERGVRLAMTVLLLMGLLAPAVRAADPSAEPASSASPASEPAGPGPAPTEPTGASSTGGIGLATAQATTTWFTGTSTGTRGRTQTFWVGITPAVDGGTVELRADGDLVATTDLVGGASSTAIAWTPPAAQTYAMTVTFTGTAAFASSTSAPYQNQVYLPPPPSMTIAADPPTVQRGVAHTFTATLPPDVGEGQVTWYVDSVASDTVDLVDGVATITRTFATTGYHSVGAQFLGNSDWGARNSGIFGFQVAGDGVVMTLSVPSDPMPAGRVALTVTLVPDPGEGTLQVRRCAWCQATDVPVTPGGETVVDLGTLGVSYYDYHVTFLGTATYAPVESHLGFSVWSETSTTLATNRTSATVGELPVTLTATIGGADPPSGTVLFEDTVNGATINLGPATIDAYTKKAVLSTSALRVGTHQIRAVYSGADWTLGSTSAPITVVVSADKAVHATFVPSRSTFYPYKDYFRDTVSLGGVLDEKATVTIRVYSGSTLKRTFSLGTVGPGKYAATWNGRTSGGTALPAGKYTVKASFKDSKGNLRTITAYTTVSWRKAIWKSVSVVQYGDQGTYFADLGDQGKLYYSDDYGRGRIMDSGEMIRDCVGCGYVGGRFRFQVRTGALEYKSMYLQVAGHGFVDREHSGDALIINPLTGNPTEQISLPYYPGIAGLTFSPARISSTGRVEAWLEMQQRWGDAFDVHYVKLTYKYAVWAP